MTILGPTATTVVAVTGADRLTYLEAVTSQHVLDARPGTVRGALHLDPHGAPLAVFDVVVLADRVLLLVPDPDLATQVVDVLGGRTFLSDARFARRDDRVLALRGEGARDALAAAGLPTTDAAIETGDDLVVVPRPGGADLLGPPEAIERSADSLSRAGVDRVDATAVERWLVADGEPAWDREVRAPHLPEELGLLPTHVHLAKGCYPGQEAVARMWMLGRPRRRLATVTVDDGIGAGWSAGTGKARTELTAVDPDAGRGLAFVPAESAPGEHIAGEDGRGVTVAGFVGEGLAVPGADPAVTRRRDRR